jgi:hypothetical protein
MSPFTCNSASTDQDVWELRMEGLLAAIETMKTRWQGVMAPRSTTIATLVDNLSEFSRQQFCYFHTLFTSTPAAQSNDFPPEYVYSHTLMQIQNDINVLQQVIDQRRSGDGVTRDTLLANADRLASLAMSHAVKAGLIEAPPIALTYFHKVPEIRVIPYADVALIAVPYLASTSRRDFLAIPHEVGHYVFWRGKTNGVPVYWAAFDKLRQQLKGRIDTDAPEFSTWYDWLAEVFADVYGCLVAGPVMAVDFQDLQKYTSRERFGQSDGHHPTPATRPFIYHQVLNHKARTGSHWAQQAKRLWLDWSAFVSTTMTGVNVDVLPAAQGASASVAVNIFTTLFKLPGTVDELVNIALELLDKVEPGDWAGDTASSDLYDAFEKDHFNETVIQGVIHDTTQQFTWISWRNNLQTDSAGWIAANAQKSLGKPKPDWWWLLQAGGWVEVGPNTWWP